MTLPIIGELLTIVLTYSTLAFNHFIEGVKFYWNWLNTTFKFNAYHIWVLMVIFSLSIMVFVALFGGMGREGDYSQGLSLGAGDPVAFALGGDYGDPLISASGETITTSICLNDIDCDGKKDTDDEDIDGDGIPNQEDDDVDGDGLSNNVDTLPCGYSVPEYECMVNNTLCGDSVCDNISLSMNSYPFGGDVWYYNIPSICLQYGTPLNEKYNVNTGVTEYGIYTSQKLRNYMSEFCDFGAELNELYYMESKENCPNDCGGEVSLTCESHSNCGIDIAWAFCCPYDPNSNCSGYCVAQECVSCDYEAYPCDDLYNLNGTCFKCVPNTEDYSLCVNYCLQGECIKSEYVAYLISPLNNTVTDDETINFNWY